MMRRNVGSVLLAPLLVLVVALVLPTPLGLSIVQGTSMEPAYSSGDLAVTWGTGSYAVGDVIVYQAGGEGVIHRVVGTNADGSYVTRGDGRDRTDPWYPMAADVRGKAVLRLPAVGAPMQRLQGALGSGGLALLAGVAVASSRTGGRGRRRLRGRISLSSPGREVAIGGAAVHVAALGVGLVVLRTSQPAWTFPIERAASWQAAVFLAAIGAFVTVGGLAAGVDLFGRSRTLRTDMRFGRRLVDVDALEVDGRLVVTVEGPNELRRAADAAGSPVFRTAGEAGVRYAAVTPAAVIVLDVRTGSTAAPGQDARSRRPIGAGTGRRRWTWVARTG